MARLPIQGGDDDIWGSVLNDYLSVGHGADGTHNYAVFAQNMLGSGVLTARPAPASTNSGKYFFVTDVDGGTLYQSNGTAWRQLTRGITAAPTAHTHNLSALGEVSITTPASDQILKYNGTAWINAANNAVAPDATTTAKGIVQLAGDLGGTATAPTVPGLAGKANTVHSHAIADVTNLQAALDGKVSGSTRITVTGTAPTTPATNDLWVDIAAFTFKYWNGTKWVAIGSSGTATTSGFMLKQDGTFLLKQDGFKIVI